MMKKLIFFILLIICQLTSQSQKCSVEVISVNTPICISESVALTAKGSGDGTLSYYWTPSTGLNKDTGSTVIATPRSTTTYIVKMSTASGCISYDTVTVRVLTFPQANFSSSLPPTDCPPVGFEFKDLSTGDITSRIWDFGDGKPPLDSNLLHFYSEPGNYRIKLVVGNKCGRDSLMKQIVIGGPVSLFTINKIDSCSNTYKFKNNSTGAAEFVWDFGDGTISREFEPSHTYLNQGTFFAKLIVTSASGCRGSSRETAVQVSKRTVNFTYNGVTTAPANLTFTNKTTPDSATRYKWNFGTGDTSSLKNPAFTFKTAGQYIVSLTATNGTCTTTYWDTVTITTPACNLIARFTHSGATTAPANLTFTNKTTPDSATRYKWNFGTGDTSSLKNPAFTFKTAGQYIVSLTATNGTCTTTYWDTVTITTPACNLIARFTHSGATTAPANLTFTNKTTPDSATRYKWNFGTGDTSSLKNPAFTFRTAGQYIVSLTATNGSCTSTFWDTVRITPPACNLIARFTHSGATTAPANLTFTNKTTPDSATRYKWNFGTGDTSSLKNPAFTFKTAGQYIVSLTATNGTCTTTYWDTVTITTPACNLIARFTHSGATTAPANLTFTNKTTPDSATRYRWSFGTGDTSSLKNPAYTFRTAGKYIVGLTATNGTCTNTYWDTVTITTPACNLIAGFTHSGATTAPANLTFTNKTTPDSATRYRWSFGTGDSSSLKNPAFTFKTAGKYIVG